jgi:hypothetical protein
MVIAFPAVTARGDGKFFVREKIPAGIPYQRAILLFDKGQETLILQSKYDLPESATVDSLGWIVPVPAGPEIAGGDADVAKDCFWMASWQTQPHLFRVSHLLSLVCFAFFLGGCALLVVCLIRYPFARRAEATKLLWSRQTRNAVIVTVIAFVLAAISMPSLSLARGSAGVEVIKTEHAGIYDVRVIRGENAEAIMEWLRENGFGVSDQDREAFDDYTLRGWCFVAAKVDPSTETKQNNISAEGMVAPLILKFAIERPVYPLTLTATAGTQTEILLYTLSDMKLTCGERLTLRHARQTGAHPILRSLVAQAELEEWPLLRDLPDKPMMLCKFKGRLTPEQMKQDLEFAPASDNEPYREQLIVW